eukprot:gnl/MRDRNA2_/MRDRNA2_113030_c0_seq1.p1 gnl/MRDRNA2_/MRDRNA2_113030_c0~~gnl/MRDRNA2_/MRDRNA2_113030_c0_seq1.p1  ORF type:complete len:367 (-),score=64.61 gnl/MRDRNA2_/MRDRNA2_113030_c0_seq1:47-1147(-)
MAVQTGIQAAQDFVASAEVKQDSTEPEIVGEYPPWLILRVPQGTYYSNEETGETTWTMPQELGTLIDLWHNAPSKVDVDVQQQEANWYHQMQRTGGGTGGLESGDTGREGLEYDASALESDVFMPTQPPHWRYHKSQYNFRGYVVQFNQDKGFGYIVGNHSDTDWNNRLYFHCSKVMNSKLPGGAYKMINYGTVVEYKMKEATRTNSKEAYDIREILMRRPELPAILPAEGREQLHRAADVWEWNKQFEYQGVTDGDKKTAYGDNVRAKPKLSDRAYNKKDGLFKFDQKKKDNSHIMYRKKDKKGASQKSKFQYGKPRMLMESMELAPFDTQNYYMENILAGLIGFASFRLALVSFKKLKRFGCNR